MCYQTGDEAKDSYFALIAAGTLVDKHFGEQADAWGQEHQTRHVKPEDLDPALAQKAAAIAANVSQMQAAA